MFLTHKKVKRIFMAEPKSTRNLAFSRRLRLAVRERFPRQTAFAKAIGKTDSDVSGYLHQGVVPEWTLLLKIREVLGVTIDSLFVDQPQAEAERWGPLLARVPHDLRQNLEACARLYASGAADLIGQVSQLVAQNLELLEFRRHDLGDDA